MTAAAPQQQHAAGLERRAYVEGWWYGLVCGVVAGASTIGLLGCLALLVHAAWVCPTC